MQDKVTIKKTPIGEIGKDVHKITVADLIDTESAYFLQPSLTPQQLARCWLDPSDTERGYTYRFIMRCAGSISKVSEPAKNVLEVYLGQTDALTNGDVRFEKIGSWQWRALNRKICKKYGVFNIEFKTENFMVTRITIEDKVPLYDMNAHEKHVRNLFSDVKRVMPHVYFELDPEGCKTGGHCSIGIKEALRKAAEETHGK